MKKRLLACLLTFCLAIGAISAFGLGASAADIVAEVTVGETAYPALTLQDAVNTAIVNEDATIKLLNDVEVGALALDGDYTLDLNGKKITVTAPLTVSVGFVTITDTSEKGTGIITADKTSAISLTGGSLIVKGGTIHAKETFAIQNCERGLLCLSGSPAITTESNAAVYVGYPNTLYGSYNGKSYTGKNLRVACGFSMTDDTVVAKNATSAQFTSTNYDTTRFTVLEQDGDLVVAQLANFIWFIFGALVIITAAVVIFTISHTVRFKRSMKFYSFSFPALFSAMIFISQTQTIAMIAAAAACVVAVITCVAMTVSQNKALKIARDAKAAADAAAKAEAEAKAAEEQAKAEAEATAKAPAEEAVAEDAPAEEAPVEEAVAEDAPAEEAPVEEAVAEDVPAEETPVEEVVAEDVPAEETPVEEAVAEDTPAEEVPVEEVVAEDVPAEEAPVEEAVAENAPAEDAPVEEAVAENAPAEDAPVVATPPKAKADRIVVTETDANGNVIYSAYKKSFTARIIQSPDDVQERYEVLKNALLSYKKVNSRVSWSYDSFKSGRKQLAKFAIRGKSLCLFLAIDPATLENSKYNIANAGDSKKYETVPCRLRLSSKRSIKWGLELITMLAEQEQLVPNPKFKPKSWRMENETTESLLEKGLIKKII